MHIPHLERTMSNYLSAHDGQLENKDWSLDWTLNWTLDLTLDWTILNEVNI